MNKLWGVVLSAGVLAIFAFMLYPVFVLAPTEHHHSSCRSQLKQLWTTMAIYTYDFDDRIAQADWMEATYPYAKNWGIYTCVELYSRNKPDHQGKPIVSGYALNYQVLGVNITKADPKCAMFFEIDALGPDVVAGTNARSARHDGKSFVGFIDTSVKVMNPDDPVRGVP